MPDPLCGNWFRGPGGCAGRPRNLARRPRSFGLLSCRIRCSVRIELIRVARKKPLVHQELRPTTIDKTDAYLVPRQHSPGCLRLVCAPLGAGPFPTDHWHATTICLAALDEGGIGR